MSSTLGASVRIFAVLAAVTLLSGSSAWAQTPVLIHPTSGPDRPIVIAVLADNFADEIDFNEAAKNFFIHGILADAFFQSQASKFTVKTLYRAGKNYGFVPGRTPGSNCSVSWDNGTETAVALEPDAASASATHIVVIGNYHYNFGCKYENWIYIAKGAVGQRVLHHEFGHLIGGLFDEYGQATTTTRGTPPPRLMRANCASVVPAPHWAGVPHVGAFPGCNLFAPVYHGFERCRMGTHGRDFCEICKLEMTAAFTCLVESGGDPKDCGTMNPQPQSIRTTSPALGALRPSLAAATLMTAGLAIERFFQDPSAPAPPLLRMLVRVRSSGDAKNPPLTILSATDSSGRHVPRLRRVGDIVYEVTETSLTTKQTQTIALGVLPSDPFEAREYAGGLNEHRRTDTPAATFLIPVPNVTRAAVLDGTRHLTVAVWRLTSDEVRSISPAVLNGLKNKGAVLVAQLTADQVRERIRGLPSH